MSKKKKATATPYPPYWPPSHTAEASEETPNFKVNTLCEAAKTVVYTTDYIFPKGATQDPARYSQSVLAFVGAPFGALFHKRRRATYGLHEFVRMLAPCLLG